MANSNYANPDSLAGLSALVERTLLDTGRLFRKNGSMPASTHLQRSIPSYYESFQGALDNLSEQIFIAKAFLERDYDAIKAREAAPQPEDVVMSDADQKGAAEVQPPPAEQPVPITEPTKVEPKAEEGVTAEMPRPAEVVSEPQPGGDAPVKKEKDSGNEAPADQGFSGANEGINFDSVLHGEGANSFDLNLDFGNDDMGDQAFLSGTFANTTETSADKPATSVAEDSTNVPAGGDAFDLELQNTGMDSNPFPDQGTGDDIMGPGESSFDDLFMETENLGEDGTGDLNQLEGDSLMNLNELDDNWFN